MSYVYLFLTSPGVVVLSHGRVVVPVRHAELLARLRVVDDELYLC